MSMTLRRSMGVPIITDSASELLMVVLSSYEVGWTLIVLLAFVLIRQVPRIFRW